MFAYHHKLNKGTMDGRVSLSDPVGKERSDEIDRMLEEGKVNVNYDLKVLVLGTGGSGKTTLIKKMKSVHHDGFSDAELAEYRPIIFKNVLDCANTIAVHMKKFGLECVESANKPLADKIIDYHHDLQNKPPELSTEIAEAIRELCMDPIITKLLDEYSSEFYLMDSASYFLAEVLRIGAPGYLPNEVDVLHAHQESLGIMETQFELGPICRIRMLDAISPWTQWKKCIHCFENIASIIFCTDLSEYDQVSPEEMGQNRLSESMALFESVINSRWFLWTSIFLFLNKADVFKKKLLEVPLEQYFPDYTGGSDLNKAAKYVLWKFMQANRAGLSVYPHLVTMSDTINVRMVFASVKEVMLQNGIRNAGFI